MLHHAGCGVAFIDTIEEGSRMGLRITFSDQGPGIDDVGLAMKDGYTSGKGMGLGLPGARRLAHEFSIETAPGEGTTVVIAMWRR
jgi:serine/threonine-protein kinase RsbT